MKYRKLVKILRWIIVCTFLLSVIVIGLYPWKNQNITLNISTDRGHKTVTFSASEISTLKSFDLIYPGEENFIIREIWFSRQFKSIPVAKIKSSDIGKYAYVDNDKICFSADMANKISELSKSFFVERIIYAETALAIAIGLWILVNVLIEKMIPENKNNHGPAAEIRKAVKNVATYGEYMIYAAKADLKAEVANSYLNRLWWILEPFCNMLVYVIVFGHIMGRDIHNYPTFVFSALLMWNFFNRVTQYSVKCVRNNRDIVTKVYVPKYVLLITNMILSFIKLMFSFVVLVVMLIIFKTDIGIAVLWIIPAYLVMMMITFGIGMILLHYGVYVDDLSYAVGILLQMLMFLSGIFYDLHTSLPAPLNGLLLCMNPVAMFTDTMRSALLGNEVQNVPLIILWLVLAMFLSYIGIHIVNKNENGYVKVI